MNDEKKQKYRHYKRERQKEYRKAKKLNNEVAVHA